MPLWKMAAPPWCWFRAARGCMEPSTKCSDIAGATRRNSWSQWAQYAGFKVERILKFNRPGVVAWWLNGKILRRRTFGLAQIRLLNLLTPLFRVLDPWLPLPPLSLIAIFRKDGGPTAISGSCERRSG